MKQKKDKWRLWFFCAMFRLCRYISVHFTLRPRNEENAGKGFVWESRIPRPILVHNLLEIEI